MPTYGSPGIGASIRMLRAASASARLSDRPSIRLSLMPGLHVERVLRDDRPLLDAGHLHADAEVRQRLPDALALGGEVHLRRADSGASASSSSPGSSQTRSTASSAASTASLGGSLGQVRLLRAARAPRSPRRAGASSSSRRWRRRRRGVGAARWRPGAGRSRRTMTGGSSSTSPPPASRSRMRSIRPGRASAAAAASARARASSAPRTAGGRAPCLVRLALVASSRSARYAATRSPIVMLK